MRIVKAVISLSSNKHESKRTKYDHQEDLKPVSIKSWEAAFHKSDDVSQGSSHLKLPRSAVAFVNSKASKLKSELSP